jgi:hypothetical protein
VTVHFPAKEECLSKRLAARGPSESALEALRDWMATTMTEAETNGSDL